MSNTKPNGQKRPDVDSDRDPLAAERARVTASMEEMAVAFEYLTGAMWDLFQASVQEACWAAAVRPGQPVGVPPSPPPEPQLPLGDPPVLSYATGRPLSSGSEHKRPKAEARAIARGYDLRYFANMVRRLRRELGVTQALFGSTVGVTSSAVGNWERGTAFPLDDTMKRMIDLFEMTQGIRPEEWQNEGTEA